MDIDPLPSSPDPVACMLSIAVNMPDFGAGQVVALLCALVALLLSGFFSGSEISYFSLDSNQIEEIEEEGKRGEKIVKLLRQPERLLATILISNNLVNVTIVVLCNYALGPVFEGLGEVMSFILQTVLLTFLILLFGEILPKLIANARTVLWAHLAAEPLKFFIWVCYPLSSMLVRSTVFVNKVVTKQAENITADDLSQALEITDVRTPDDKEMLEGILKFGDTTASEIMTPRIDITDIDITADFASVMEVIVESGFSRLPVYEGTADNIKGILYARDMLPYVGVENLGFKWQRLIREPYFVPESRMIDDLLEDFRKRRIHMAVVIDEFGGTQGVVTLEDVLEEIVGDIDDEYDEVQLPYKKLPDDTYIFEGKTLLTDFFRITGQDEEEYAGVAEDCETLAGMLLNIKGDFPKKKESLVYGRCRFLVLDIEHHRISSVRVKVMNDIQLQ